MKYNIRISTEADKGAILHLMGDLHNHLSGYFPMANWDSVPEPYASHVENKIKKNQGALYLCEQDGTICGYCLGWVIDEEDHEIHPDIRKHGHIEDIYIRPEFRRTGMGKCLLNALIQHFQMQKIKRITLGFLKENSEAERFYQSCGFSAYFMKMQLYTGSGIGKEHIDV